jgi:hypothetical protein
MRESNKKEDSSPNYEDMEVSSLAYHLWQTAGRPAGRYMEFWAEAEQRFRAEHEARDAKRPAASSPSA